MTHLNDRVEDREQGSMCPDTACLSDVVVSVQRLKEPSVNLPGVYSVTPRVLSSVVVTHKVSSRRTTRPSGQTHGVQPSYSTAKLSTSVASLIT